MAGVVSASINTFSADHARILPEKRICWGILGKVEPVGDGLTLANLSGKECLVDESLQPTLAGLLGQPATIGYIAGKWRAGRCTGTL